MKKDMLPKKTNLREPEAKPAVTSLAEDNAAAVHHRRPHYRGRYPRNFAEKYKELQPDKYAGTIAKVESKGSTPAGMHIPIMVAEILNFLQIKPGQRGLDATLGYGGHTKAMLEKLQHQGHLYATDIDPLESVKTTERLAKLGYGPEILTVRQLNFAKVDQLAAQVGMFDFLLADLGVSSMQLDNPQRGFSYKTDGPLDLRMNPLKGVTGAQRLLQLDQEELEGMLMENADEPYAAQIAKTIWQDLRSGHRLETTSQLRREVIAALKFLPAESRQEAVKKSCARTFQALRIDVNNELEVLYTFLAKLPSVMQSGGRIAILTFHSGEDRLVKKAFKSFYQEGLLAEISPGVIRPSSAECIRNPRAHSTKLRWAIKA